MFYHEENMYTRQKHTNYKEILETNEEKSKRENNRCISYLTFASKNEIPISLSTLI